MIVPEVWQSYVVQRTMELSELVQSGIVQHSEEFDRLASAPSRTVHMPFWNDLTGEDEVMKVEGDLVPDKIAADKDEAVILRRAKAWGTHDLAAALAGSDPAKAIADLVAAFWARRMQAALLATLDGVFAAATMSGNVHDITAQYGMDGVFTGETFIDAVQKLGDAKSQLVGIMMHSATEAHLAKQNLIQVMQPADGSPAVSTYMGKRVIVDDGCPALTGGKYVTYIFGLGAVAYGNGAPVGQVPVETERKALASEEYLVNRKTWILHPRGVAFQSASVTGISPTNVELAKATNWKRVWQPKAIRMVRFVHLLAPVEEPAG